MAKPMAPSTILIVGASRGLGLGLAREYLARGWQVIGTVRSGATPLHALAAEQPGRLEIETVDIDRPEQVAALRRRLDGRRIDLLFVNAGVLNDRTTTIGEVSTEAFTRLMVTNALSPMRVVEAFAGLVPAGGTIAAMSSGLGSVANNQSGGCEIYRASKAALNTLMRSFATRQRLARNLFVVAPGWVRTEMAERSAGAEAKRRNVTTEQVWEERAAIYPEHRVLTPREVAETIAFLCSDAASGINGEAVTVALGGIW